MPNLAEIRRRIYDASDFDPQDDGYDEATDRKINDHHDAISDLRDWPWLQTEAGLTFYTDVTAASGGGVSVTAQAGARNLVGVGTAFTSDYEGATFVDSSGNEYTIEGVENLTSLYLSSNWQLTVGVSYDVFTVKWRTIPLPVNCAELLAIVDRGNDRGIVDYLDRKPAERLYLDRDDTGTIQAVIEDDAKVDRAPVRPPTLVAGSAGTLRTNTKYEYRYTIYRQGRESAPSPAAVVTTGATTPSVTVSAMEDLSYWDGLAYREMYRRKYVYRRDVTNKGPWLRVGVVNTAATTTFPDTAEVPLTLAGEFHAMVVQDPTTPRRYVRPWPRPSEDTTLTARYKKSPKPLVGNTDVPDWPKRYHHLLSYLVASEIAANRGGTATAALAERRADKLLQEMVDREMTEGARDVHKGKMKIGGGRRGSIYGTPSIS